VTCADATQFSPEQAIRDVARLGPFFAVAIGGAAGEWRRARDTYADGWAERVAATGGQLGTTEVRVAAATVQFGFAARLWSPALACALLHGVVIDVDDLHISAAGPLALMLPAPEGRVGCDAQLLYQSVADRHLAPLHDGLKDKVAEGLLWGNAASAMIAALRIITESRPDLSDAARGLASELLATGQLRATGELSDRGLVFRRRSCCLFYRVAGGGYCGDCSLVKRTAGFS
jgi:FhuF 2Fe-2S C-terminal domain